MILLWEPREWSLVLEQDVVLQSIDRAIEAVHNAAMKNGGKYNLEQRDVLQKLIHHRKETVSRKSHSPTPQGTVMTQSSSDHHLDVSRQPNGVCRTGYERHHSLPNTEFEAEDEGLYQVTGWTRYYYNNIAPRSQSGDVLCLLGCKGNESVVIQPQAHRAAPVTPPPPEKRKNTQIAAPIKSKDKLLSRSWA
ncbi:hypothetical protein EK904_005991 [Melospiza melodia maxima]|nr:hypothetical protein EK904_005991 [Melospiza melodia maxima]